MISKNIKKEPEFSVRNIKKEPEFVTSCIKTEPKFSVTAIKTEPGFGTRSIKQEPGLEIESTVNKSTTKITGNNLAASKTKSRRKRRKLTRKCKTVKKKISRTSNSKVERIPKTCNKKVKTRKSRSLTSKKPSKRQKRKTKKKGKVTKSVKLTGTKKEGRTLLDQQSSTELRLFGFKDELDCFTAESDSEEIRESSGITAKRTNLSRLDARKKVLLALKSKPTASSSKSRHVIEAPESENVDLLGSILNSQALWHSKDSKMKVKEDGSVEVISGRLNTKSANTNRKSKALDIQETKINKISVQKPKTTQPTTNKCLENDLLNESEPQLNYVCEINIKKETPEICDDKDIIAEQKIKTEVEVKNSPKFNPCVSPTQEFALFHSPKSEDASDNEGDDCPIFSIYSESSRVFSRQRVKERRLRSASNDSDIQIIEIKETKRTPGGRREESKHRARTWKKENSTFQLESGRSTCRSSRSRSPTRKDRNRSRSRSRSVLAASTFKVKDEPL